MAMSLSLSSDQPCATRLYLSPHLELPLQQLLSLHLLYLLVLIILVVRRNKKGKKGVVKGCASVGANPRSVEGRLRPRRNM
jgi:hypothetical protein